MAKSEEIIIIGGGASGLAAASKLYQNGVTNVTILEASERLGGRAYSVPTSLLTRNDQDGYLEMGAQWIHGQIGSPSYKIANENGLVDPEPSNLEGIILVRENEPISENWDEDLWTLFEIMEEEPENKDIFPGISMEQYILTHKNTTLYSNVSAERQKYIKPFLDLYNRYQQGDWSADWNNLSYNSIINYDVPGGPEGSDYTRFKAEHCYNDLINIIKKDIPSDKIHLHSPVSSVNYTSDTIKVELEDGSILEADKVVFTGSLGVLKDEIITFDPALPEDKQSAIEMMGFGVLAKIYLEFDQPWAAQDWVYGFSFMFPDAIEYTEDDAEKDWTRFFSGIYAVDFHPTIAELWIGGFGAIKMESLSGYQLRQDIEKFLHKFKPGMNGLINIQNTSQILTITVSIKHTNHANARLRDSPFFILFRDQNGIVNHTFVDHTPFKIQHHKWPD